MSVDANAEFLEFRNVDKIKFIGTSSNTIIDTTTGRLGIGTDTPAYAIDVRGTANVTALSGITDFNFQPTSNTASIEYDSNVVTEFNRSKKLIKYPRVALTESTSGGYTAQTSSFEISTQDAWYAFDKSEPDGNTSRWRTASSRYTNSGATSPSEYLFTGSEAGAWSSIELPEKMKLVYYTMTGIHTHTPQEGVIYGYDSDTSTWHKVSTFYFNTEGTSGNTPLFSPEFHTEEGVGLYSKYAMIVTKTNGHGAPSLYEWKLYGLPEYDPDAAGMDVKVTSYPNIPNTDWLEVYYDAKNYTSGSNVQDETANNRDGVLYGNTSFSSADGIHKFDFDGNGDYIKTTLTGFTGTTVTFSAWVFIDSIDTSRPNTIMGLGSWGSTGSAAWIAVGSSGTLETGNKGITSCGGSVQATTLTKRWLHITGIVSSGDFRFFQDGQLLNSLTTTGTINYGTDPVLYLATRANSSGDPEATRYLDCKIANARLFNRALTSDEVWQLYAYQKEYFGHGDLSMTLKAGRLGIGTSEPRAALDVGGDIIGGCPVFFHATRTDGHLNSATNPVIFNNVVSSKGGGYNASTGKFTCPIAGYYKIYCYGITDSGNHLDLRLRINNSDQTFGKAYAWANITNHVQAHATSIVYLNHNDVVHYRLADGSFSGSGTTSNQANANGFIMEYFSS